MTTETVLNVDDLAQEIRRVDGKHDLGAGALAEALLPFIEQAVLQSEQVQAWKRDAERYRKVRRMDLQHYSDIYMANLQSGAPFDLLVDAAMEKQP